jgi:diguanylate cyclase (GGDEF)-like protein
VPRLVAEKLATLTGIPTCEVATLERGVLRVIASVEHGRRRSAREGVVLDPQPRRLPAAAAAAAGSEPFAVFSATQADLPADGRRLLEERGGGSLLVVPLMVDGQFAGTVELSDVAVRDFDREIGVVREFAEIAAQALGVAAFVGKLAARDRAARELVAVSGLASQATASDELLRSVTCRLSSAIAASGCDIYGIAGDRLVVVASARRGAENGALLGAAYELAEHPAATLAIATREPLVFTDSRDPRLTGPEARRFRDRGLAAECSLPLFSGETMVGILDIFDDDSAGFLEYLDLINGVGQIVADSLVKTRLLTDLARQNELMSALVELGAIVPAVSDVGAAFSSLGARLIETIDADTCELYSLQGERIELLAGFDREGAVERIGWTGDLHDYPTCAASLSRGETLIVASRDDPRLSAYERERYSKFEYQSEICVPLVVDGHAIGFLDIFDTAPRDFVEFADFLRGFAPVLARTTQNALLLREVGQRNVELRDLVRLGEIASQETDLAGLLRLAAGRLLATLDVASCEVYRVEGEELVQLAGVGPASLAGDSGRRAPIASFPGFAEALEQGGPCVIGSLDDPRLSAVETTSYRRRGLKSSLSVPLVVSGEAVAVIGIADSRERDYAEHVDFMRSVGQLLAGAFEKTLLLGRLEAGNRELRQLVDAGLEFGSSLEMDEVLRSVATRMRTAAEATCCDIYSYRGDVEVGLTSIEADDSADLDFVGTVYRIADMSITGLALERRQPVAVADIETDEHASELERTEWRRFGYRSGLVVPLITGAEVVGFAEVFDEARRDFDHAPVLYGLAQVAAQALANAALHAALEEAAARMKLVTEAGLEFSSSLDLRDTLVKVGRRLSAAVDVPNCDIDLVLDNGPSYRLMNVIGEAVEAALVPTPFDLALYPTLRQALETREPVIVASLDDPRLTAEGRAANRAHGEKSWLIVPLVTKDKVIGVVDLVETRRERTFSKQEIDTATAICRVAAMAIDNADLYDSLAATNHETEMLNAIAREAAASLDVGEIARAATGRLRQIVPFEGSLMLLVNNDCLHVAYADEAERLSARHLETLPLAALPQAFRDALVQRPVTVLRLPGDSPLTHTHPELVGSGAVVLVALVVDGSLAGGLVLHDSHPDAFDALDTRTLERVSTHLALAVKNARLYADIKAMHLSNLRALSSALNAKDYYTIGHAARVSAYMVLLGSKLGWPEALVRGAEEAAYLHDIGKIAISDRVLLKPGKLDAQEWELMRQHPVFSAEIIRTLFAEELVLGVRHHHERWDGAGYPDGLSGAKIPVIARAMCVVDSYDAMSFLRPYRRALDADACLQELRRCSGRQFDPAITSVFLEVLDDLDARRRAADDVAAQAAARIDPETHLRLRLPRDEAGADYAAIAAILREVRDANPPTMHLTTQARLERRFVMVVDPEQDPGEHSPLGTDLFPNEVLQVFPRIPSDARPRVNALFADQFGVWVTGVAPIRDARGDFVAIVVASLPPFVGAEQGGLRAAGKEALASILQSAAVRSNRAEINAVADGLTGLYNHRYLNERLGEELRRSEELAAPLSLLFGELDELRELIDALGHDAGDDALSSTAHIIEQSIRHVDLASRYGEEEFVVALIGTDAEDAVDVAERIRQRVHETRVGSSPEPLSISIGVAAFPSDGLTMEELLDKAEWAMHVARRLGRNRVVAFPTGPSSYPELPV